jgi:hypothetical protein
LEDVDHFSSNLPVFCHESNQCLSLRVWSLCWSEKVLHIKANAHINTHPQLEQ